MLPVSKRCKYTLQPPKSGNANSTQGLDRLLPPERAGIPGGGAHLPRSLRATGDLHFPLHGARLLSAMPGLLLQLSSSDLHRLVGLLHSGHRLQAAHTILDVASKGAPSSCSQFMKPLHVTNQHYDGPQFGYP